MSVGVKMVDFEVVVRCFDVGVEVDSEESIDGMSIRDLLLFNLQTRQVDRCGFDACGAHCRTAISISPMNS